MFHVFYRDVATIVASFITKDILFPNPVHSRNLKLNLVEASEFVDIKIDILGEDSSDTYAKDDIFEETFITRGKHK